MKNFVLLLLVLSIGAVSCTKLSTDKQKNSYVLGHNFGSEMRRSSSIDPEQVMVGFNDQLRHVDKDPSSQSEPYSYLRGKESAKMVKQFGIPIDAKSFALGFNDAFEKKKKLEKKAFRKIMSQLVKKINQFHKKVGEKFLTMNKTKKNIKETASGLQYQILKKGTGPRPSSKLSKVRVHYKGSLLNGTQFDSSYERNKPAEFPLNRVIKGWTEGLQLMNVGSKYKFFIPWKLGYGRRGSPPKIPGYSLLIFEVELLAIVK